jgi:hypothetical protein
MNAKKKKRFQPERHKSIKDKIPNGNAMNMDTG